MILRLFALLSLILLPAAHAAPAVNMMEATVPMKAVRSGAHSYFVQGRLARRPSENQGFMSNAGFVVTRVWRGRVRRAGLAAAGRETRRPDPQGHQQPIRRVIVSHYHADHFYGLQIFKALGAEIWRHRAARRRHPQRRRVGARLAQRKEVLFPWVDEHTRLLEADRFLEGDTDFDDGGAALRPAPCRPAHSSEDMAMLVREDRVLYAGDLVFAAACRLSADADSRAWIAALDKLIALKPRVPDYPAHGAPSRVPRSGPTFFTRDLSVSSCAPAWAQAARDLVPFDEAYEQTDWSKYRSKPPYDEANRVNAYNQYLRLEQEGAGE